MQNSLENAILLKSGLFSTITATGAGFATGSSTTSAPLGLCCQNSRPYFKTGISEKNTIHISPTGHLYGWVSSSPTDPIAVRMYFRTGVPLSEQEANRRPSVDHIGSKTIYWQIAVTEAKDQITLFQNWNIGPTDEQFGLEVEDADGARYIVGGQQEIVFANGLYFPDFTRISWRGRLRMSRSVSYPGCNYRSMQTLSYSRHEPAF